MQSPISKTHLLERLRRDRYNPGEGRDDVDRWHRASWNAGMDRAIEIVDEGDVAKGLRELVANAPPDREGELLDCFGVPPRVTEGQ